MKRIFIVDMRECSQKHLEGSSPNRAIAHRGVGWGLGGGRGGLRGVGEGKRGRKGRGAREGNKSQIRNQQA